MKDFRKPTNRPAVTEYDFFTGGDTKTADFAIYYNIAFDNVDRVVKQLKNRSEIQQGSFLAEYLWKAHIQSKNSNGYELTSVDKKIISELIKKVEEIRNFHSHIWHDNSVLQFSAELKSFVERKYDEAKASLYAEFPSALTDFEYLQQTKSQGKFQLFKNVKGLSFVTVEGRIFFLSFFLSTGQMNQFLQQRVGSKRSDLPQFKIKRLLYTFYCHRDGAAIVDFNHENTFIDSMDVGERKNVLKARTAYKLITYLFDYPDYWGSKEAMPLFDANGAQVVNVLQLKMYIEDNEILPGYKFQLLQGNFELEAINENSEDCLKDIENKYRTGTIAFTLDDMPKHIFHITFATLHRLVLLQLLQSDKSYSESPIERLAIELKKQVVNRETLYRILTKSPSERNDVDLEYLLNKENQYLRGGRKLTEIGVSYFEAIGKSSNEDHNNRVLLVNYLRDWYTLAIEINDKTGNKTKVVEPEPIQVYQNDFVLGTRQKFRAGNRFVFYTAKYLMDFGSDDYYWGMEKFEFGKVSANSQNDSLLKKKSYFKASEIPLNEDYRLTLENDHIYLATIKNEDATYNHERFHQFSFGPKAMRYLATYIQKNEQLYASQLSSFLNALSDDLTKLQEKGKWIATDEYILLEKPFISNYLIPSNTSFDTLKSKLRSRIDHINKEWEHALANMKYLRRAEKNKLVMNAYRLFNWASDRSDGKFLRLDEYNQMSVCHFSLHLKKPIKGKPGKFDYLFKTLFRLGVRQPPIPNEIKAFLNKAESLDHLLEMLIEDRKVFLNSLLELPTKLLRKELPSVCSKLGISVPVEFKTEESKSELEKKHLHTLQVQPFMVHPMLILKYFFNKEYVEGKTMVQATDKNGNLIYKRPTISLFLDLRKNRRLTKPLHAPFYSETIAKSLYSKPTLKKQNEKLNGLISSTQTEDILLWWIAQRYLTANEFTKQIGETIKKQDGVTIGNLSTVNICLPLMSIGEEDPVKEVLYTAVQMNQLDDLMFLTERTRLRKAAVHFLRRCGIENSFWNDDLKRLSSNQFGGKDLPTGAKDNPLPFQLLRDEIELVRRSGHKLAEYILAFEKKTLYDELQNHYSGNKNKFHAWLINEFKASNDRKVHFNFNSIINSSFGSNLELNKTYGDALSKCRNVAFHNDIPIGSDGTFAWQTREGHELRALLGIQDDIIIKKNRSIYYSI